MVILLDSFDPDPFSTCEPLWAQHPSASVFYSAMGQSFKLTRHYTLTSVKFRLCIMGSPSGSVKAVLYAHTGIFGSGNATGPALATSEVEDISQLPTYPTTALIEFSFIGDNQYVLETAVPYFIIIQTLSDTVVDISNNVRVAATFNFSVTHEGNAIFYRLSAWYSTTVQDILFYLYGNPASRTGYIGHLKPLALSGYEGTNEEYIKAKSDSGVLITS